MDGRVARFRSFFFLVLPVVFLSAFAAEPDTHPGRLWLIENQGVLEFHTWTARLEPEFTGLQDMDAVGTDYSNGDAWLYGASRLVSIADDRVEEFRLTGLPEGNAVALEFDDLNGQSWIAIGSTLVRVSSDGVVLGQQALDADIVALAFDRMRERIWAAMPRKVAVFDPGGNPLFTIEYRQAGRIHDLAYDRGLDRIWVTSHAGVRVRQSSTA